jgi:hypothetical protein
MGDLTVTRDAYQRLRLELRERLARTEREQLANTLARLQSNLARVFDTQPSA